MVLVLRVVTILVLACLPVRAEEMEFDVDIDTALVCDTQQQVERFVALFEGDVGAALRAVNGEQESPTACDIATIAYVPSDDVTTTKGPCGHFRVVKILLVGVLTEDHGFLFTVPSPYFTMQPVGTDGNVSQLRSSHRDRLPTRASIVTSTAECRVFDWNQREHAAGR